MSDEHLTLKGGTLKGWDDLKSDEARAAMSAFPLRDEEHLLGAALGAARDAFLQTGPMNCVHNLQLKAAIDAYLLTLARGADCQILAAESDGSA